MATFRAACVQLNSGDDLAANLRSAGSSIRAAVERGAQLVMLPEYAALLDGSGRVMRENSHPEAQHPALADIDAAEVHRVRGMLPSLEHDRGYAAPQIDTGCGVATHAHSVE